MNDMLPNPDQTFDWIHGIEEVIAAYLIDETDPATRDSTVLMGINVAIGGTDSEGDRLVQVRRLIAGRDQASKVRGDSDGFCGRAGLLVSVASRYEPAMTIIDENVGLVPRKARARHRLLPTPPNRMTTLPVTPG